MTPPITFSWQINIGHILIAFSTLLAGTAAYVDLRRDVSEHARTLAAHEARIEALNAGMSARDIANATFVARFGTFEELML